MENDKTLIKQGRLNDTYTLKEQLGSGGGGVVYKAYHERLKTHVVVKQVKEEVKGRIEGRAEADVLKRLKHTYLPRVYDFLEIDGEIYTVMDFIPGESLKEALEKAGRFPQKQVLKWAGQLAEAVAYLHSQEPPIIHSDIKPANVMLMPGGDICLIDFNISLAFDSDRKLSTGISGGYSPPEQYHDMTMYRKLAAMGKAGAEAVQDTVTMAGASETAVMTGMEETIAMEAPDDTVSMEASGRTADLSETVSMIDGTVGRGIDERSDIYSLGATLYHLLTGIKPSNNFEEIVPLSRCQVPVSEGLAHIIEKMMEILPENRYQNGGELLQALRHIYELDSEYRAYKRRGRHKAIALAVLYVAGAALIGTGWTTMQRETLTAYNRAVERAGELIEEAFFDQARTEINQAMDLLPGKVAAYEKEVLRLYSMGDYEGSVRYGRDVINNPAYTIEEGEEGLLGDIFYVVGNSYFEQEDYRNAIHCFTEAISRNQKNSMYFSDYAIALAKTGNVQEAEEALETAISLGLGQDSIYMVQGEIAFAKGENETAIQHLQASIQSTEQQDLRRRAVLLCAQAYERMGDGYLDDEIALLEGAVNTFSVEVSMHMLEELADAYARKAETGEEAGAAYYPKALEGFISLYERGYSTRQMMENIAIIYQQMDQMDQAEDMLNQTMETYPNDYRAYKRMAFLEADKQQKKANEERDYMQMKEAYEKAVELYGESGLEGDTEMQMLETMMKDLEDGGWF